MEKVIKALSNDIRLRLIMFIRNQEKSVNEMVDFLGSISQSAVSQHLAILREAKILEVRRDKQKIFYRISDQCKKEVEDLLNSISFLVLAIGG